MDHEGPCGVSCPTAVTQCYLDDAAHGVGRAVSRRKGRYSDTGYNPDAPEDTALGETSPSEKDRCYVIPLTGAP